MTRPIQSDETPYTRPEERWLLDATALATACRILIDETAATPCTIDRAGRIICIRADLTLDELMHVLPRAALIIRFGGATALEHGRPCFGLRVVTPAVTAEASAS